MLSANNNQFFVEINDFSLLIAKTSSALPPLTVEAVLECQLNQGSDQIIDKVQQFADLGQGQFAQAVCGISPKGKMIRRATLENPAKTRDPAFLPQYLTKQFKIDLAEYSVAVLNADGGAGFNPDVQLTKELMFCGSPRDEIIDIQQTLIDYFIFPKRIELTGVASIGGVNDLMRVDNESMPTLILELGHSQAQVLICNGSMLDVARPIPHGLDSMYPVVQKELGLKDIESAKKLFTSSTFDFTEMGGILLKKLLKELQASTGFYEVQTGMTIGHIHVSSLPQNLSWIPATLSKNLGVEALAPNYSSWLQAQEITVSDDVGLANLGTNWLGLFSLMGRYHSPVKK